MPVRPAPAGHTVWSRCQAEPPIAHLLHRGEFSLHLFDFFELVFEAGCGKLISSATWGIKADRKQFCLQTKRCHRGCKQMCDLFTYSFLKSNTRQRKIVTQSVSLQTFADWIWLHKRGSTSPLISKRFMAEGCLGWFWTTTICPSKSWYSDFLSFCEFVYGPNQRSIYLCVCICVQSYCGS